jgi:hypothetical protein
MAGPSLHVLRFVVGFFTMLQALSRSRVGAKAASSSRRAAQGSTGPAGSSLSGGTRATPSQVIGAVEIMAVGFHACSTASGITSHIAQLRNHLWAAHEQSALCMPKAQWIVWLQVHCWHGGGGCCCLLTACHAAH